MKLVVKIAVLSAAILCDALDTYSQGRGRGLPAEKRDVIHGLFDAHDKFKRVVKQTDDGYVSKTTSDDPDAVKLIQTHLRQMEERLKKGLMVRRWDPAYEEFVNHYDDIEIKITNIKNGVSIEAIGKTENAKKVARNHAKIISNFVKRGWKEHDRRHPAALTAENESENREAAAVEEACEEAGGNEGGKCSLGGKTQIACCSEEKVANNQEKCENCEKLEIESK